MEKVDNSRFIFGTLVIIFLKIYYNQIIMIIHIQIKVKAKIKNSLVIIEKNISIFHHSLYIFLVRLTLWSLLFPKIFKKFSIWIFLTLFLKIKLKSISIINEYLS